MGYSAVAKMSPAPGIVGVCVGTCAEGTEREPSGPKQVTKGLRMRFRSLEGLWRGGCDCVCVPAMYLGGILKTCLRGEEW